MSRHLARETAMCLVFEKSFGTVEPLMRIQLVSDNKLDSNDEEYVDRIIKGVSENLENIDKLIAEYSKEWKIDRLAKVDLAIMRLSVYEMLYCDDIVENISINEAIELSKKYSGPQAPQFINGILDSIYKQKGR